MAKKYEERILVLTTHNKDGECECVMQDGCHANDSCAICNVGMTRQEIVKHAAKVIRKKLFKNEDSTQKIKEEGLEQEYNRYVDFICEYIAEMVLNALLEASNER